MKTKLNIIKVMNQLDIKTISELGKEEAMKLLELLRIASVMIKAMYLNQKLVFQDMKRNRYFRYRKMIYKTKHNKLRRFN